MSADNQVSDKILGRIEKLLRMDNDKGSVHEADIAARRAAALMEEYNVELAEIIKHKKKFEGADIIDQAFYPKMYVRFPMELQILSAKISKLFDCEANFKLHYDNGGWKKQMWIYGHSTDVKMAVWLLNYIDNSAKKSVREYTKECRMIGVGAKKAKYIAGFYRACRENVAILIAEKNAKNLSDSTALVVVKKDAIGKKYGEFSYTKIYNHTNIDEAYINGYHKGVELDLNTRGIEGNSSAGQLS